jgi:hypothetical protein
MLQTLATKTEFARENSGKQEMVCEPEFVTYYVTKGREDASAPIVQWNV